MIVYFTGTGNSKYVSNRLGKELQDETLNLFMKIKNQDMTSIQSQKPWVIVTPTYAWRIPRIIHKWLQQTKLIGNQNVYFVMTCGGSIGNAGQYAEKLCIEKGMKFMGCIPIVMPENYIALYDAPSKEEETQIIRNADSAMKSVVSLIANRKLYTKPTITFKDRMASSIVNDIFYPVLVHAKKFYETDACISCGKCEIVCPLSNIHLKEGKPVWGTHCTHCMACINQCPTEAIEYGNHTKGLRRYTCPED